ncbi:MAG TPA: hypothetical protein DD381_12645 [Lentisphaeria bacterium]|nr:MAG: hypothetical protein A2X47_12215 [Lentisphaerae bacterium GWF2_38_69]HBM17173.1 hypothetical protein [Lentisphaeria bacterium]
MKKAILVLMFLSLSICCLNAAEQPLPTIDQKDEKVAKLTEDEAFRQKINDLINQRRQVSMSIYQTRVDLIKSDPNLRVLHQAIIDLHEKMAKELNANPKMVVLIDKGNELDKEMAQLIQQYQASKSAVGVQK